MLMWAPVPGATSYNVYRSEVSGGPYQKIAGDLSANNYMDQGISTEKTYFYVVKAVAKGVEGDPSPQFVLRGAELLKTPAFGGFLITDDNKVSLRWDLTPRAVFYNLFRSETEKGEYKQVASVQDTRYTDGNVSIGKTYYYKVSAVDSNNSESSRSAKPLVAKVEKKAAAEAGVGYVRKPLEYVDAFEVDKNEVIRQPVGIAVDEDGNFYAVEGGGYLQKISPDFKFLMSIGKNRPEGIPEKEWGRANGIFYDRPAKEIYVAYPNVNRIRVFSTDGVLSRTYSLAFAKNAPETVVAPAPVGVAVGDDKTIWVLDGWYFQLIGLNQKGEEVSRLGLPRDHPDRNKPDDKSLVTPNFLAIDPSSGNLYVSEGLVQRVTAYDRKGNFLRWVGGRGAGPGGFQQPSGLAVGNDGVLYAADKNMGRIQAFDSKGAYLFTYINPKVKEPDKQLIVAPGVTGIAVSGERLYVSDVIKDRVVVYKMPK